MTAERFTPLPQFTGLDVVIVEDDDERMADIEESAIGTDGVRIYCRRTLWARIEHELDQLPGTLGTLQ